MLGHGLPDGLALIERVSPSLFLVFYNDVPTSGHYALQCYFISQDPTVYSVIGEGERRRDI